MTNRPNFSFPILAEWCRRKADVSSSLSLTTSSNLSFFLCRERMTIYARLIQFAGPIRINYSATVWKVEEFIARVGPQKFWHTRAISRFVLRDGGLPLGLWAFWGLAWRDIGAALHCWGLLFNALCNNYNRQFPSKLCPCLCSRGTNLIRLHASNQKHSVHTQLRW